MSKDAPRRLEASGHRNSSRGVLPLRYHGVNSELRIKVGQQALVIRCGSPIETHPSEVLADSFDLAQLEFDNRRAVETSKSCRLGRSFDAADCHDAWPRLDAIGFGPQAAADGIKRC